MKKLLLPFTLLMLTACGGSSSDETDDSPKPIAPSAAELSPSSLQLDVPPTNGKLPSELLPPS